jgi:Fe-S-cluster containining protein
MKSGKPINSFPEGPSMESERNNPCLICSSNQRCCSQLSGLRLSKQEFENFFSSHSNELSIRKDNNMFIVSSIRNGPCPHWGKSGCIIYSDRPIDCRLYPYEIIRLSEKRKAIEVRLINNPGCPHRDSLLMPFEEAKSLIKVLCHTVYGQGKPVIVKYVQAREGSSRFFDNIRTRLSKIIEAFR